jgi:hypothetical protein
VRTTLNLTDDLLSEAKALAAREKLTLTRRIEEGLALRLRGQRPMSAPASGLPLPVFQGRCWMPLMVSPRHDPGSERAGRRLAQRSPPPSLRPCLAGECRG